MHREEVKRQSAEAHSVGRIVIDLPPPLSPTCCRSNKSGKLKGLAIQSKSQQTGNAHEGPSRAYVRLLSRIHLTCLDEGAKTLTGMNERLHNS